MSRMFTPSYTDYDPGPPDREFPSSRYRVGANDFGYLAQHPHNPRYRPPAQPYNSAPHYPPDPQQFVPQGSYPSYQASCSQIAAADSFGDYGPEKFLHQGSHPDYKTSFNQTAPPHSYGDYGPVQGQYVTTHTDFVRVALPNINNDTGAHTEYQHHTSDEDEGSCWQEQDSSNLSHQQWNHSGSKDPYLDSHPHSIAQPDPQPTKSFSEPFIMEDSPEDITTTRFTSRRGWQRHQRKKKEKGKGQEAFTQEDGGSY
jgi:hypothetical protein